uniref:Thioredoxin domain-containing protein n=1 Tax=Amphora coffeiformis TaxID=265554 RepID=A0A7S3P7H5_9STRA|mmetsp:Transcript_8444/g.16148  ORF Transcript_8444/g.16148 Transcript_8444/m.16148 type:complete len:565 (+) Transcript_8444:122-1816(+)|eukprot:scaffold132_cov170-Amphora_coffeaeformis.AAC.58
MGRTTTLLSLVGALAFLVEQGGALSTSTTLPSSSRVVTGRSTMSRSATSFTYYTIIDGSSWESLRDSPLMSDGGDGKALPSSMGSIPVVTGTLESTQEEVIGLFAGSGSGENKNGKDSETLSLTTGQVVWKESVARLQGGVKPEEAAATYATALTHLYPLMAAQLSSVGGSGESFTAVSVPKDSVVVLGGNPEAVWAARALATLGSKVTLVSLKKPSIPESVNVLTPNDSDTFAESVGKFEALLDTIGRYGPQSRPVQLLASRHGCHAYRSARTKAEEIVASEGLLWGPGKVKEYLKSLPRKASSAPSATLPVAGWGAVVERLLKAKLVAPSLQTIDQSKNSATWARGFSLKATWEANTWPSTTDGTRFGFPTLEEDEDDEDDEYDDLVVTSANLSSRVQPRSEEALQEQESNRIGTRARAQPSSTSPYIQTVYGPEGLEEDVIKPELDCILFMSAPFCRTCKKLQAPYARLARLNHEDANSQVVFAKADVVGSFGKALGKSLGINAVPTFVLFRKGERFGRPLIISKLPDQQFDLALEYLKDREEWDDSQFDTDDKNNPRTKI